MNTPLKQVCATYVAAVLTAILYAPWYGQPQTGAIRPHVQYALLWRPPQTIGYLYVLDFTRIFLEVLSLTRVLLLAISSLGGEKPEE